MKPVDFQESNCTIGGEIPANRTMGMVLTKWRGTLRERLWFLLKGTIILMVKGDTMPPTLVSAEPYFEIENP